MKRNRSLVGRIAAAALAVGVATCVPQTQANAAYLGEVGFYGPVPIVPGLTPRLWYANPVIAIGAAVGLAPLYLNVPALHRLNWLEYCGLYGACYSPVYFIHDDWYRYTYVPYFVRHYGRPGPGRGPGPGPAPAPAPGGPGGPGGNPNTPVPLSSGPQGGIPVPNQIRSNTAPATTSARSAGTPSTMSARPSGSASTPSTMSARPSGSASTPSTMSARSAGSVGSRSAGASAPRPMGGGSMGGARGGGGPSGGARGGGGGGRR